MTSSAAPPSPRTGTGTGTSHRVGPRDPVARTALVAFAVVAVVHLVAQLADLDAVTNPTQWALMPLLAVTLWATARDRPRARLVRLTLLALGLSWLGDTVPDLVGQDLAFLAMVGCFLLAQLAYVAAFVPYRRRSVLRRPLRAAPYAIVLVALLIACLPGADDLAVPVVVYGVCLTTMAVLATGVHRLAAVGGAVFLISDGLIALDAFAPGYDLPAHGFWVMATYVVGQALITAGVLRAAPDPSRGAGNA